MLSAIRKIEHLIIPTIIKWLVTINIKKKNAPPSEETQYVFDNLDRYTKELINNDKKLRRRLDRLCFKIEDYFIQNHIMTMDGIKIFVELGAALFHGDSLKLTENDPCYKALAFMQDFYLTELPKEMGENYQEFHDNSIQHAINLLNLIKAEGYFSEINISN
jgi:hypothetical protein